MSLLSGFPPPPCVFCRDTRIFNARREALLSFVLASRVFLRFLDIVPFMVDAALEHYHFSLLFPHLVFAHAATTPSSFPDHFKSFSALIAHWFSVFPALLEGTFLLCRIFCVPLLEYL